MKQKNFKKDSLDMNTHIAVMPKKIRKDWKQRRAKNKLGKVKIVTKCKCGKPLEPPFSGFICGDCLKKWDVQKYCQILARDYYGKANKCIKCGIVAKHGIEWHHLDYSKPLEVIPLCKKCHGLAHRLGYKFEGSNVKPRMKELSNYDSE